MGCAFLHVLKEQYTINICKFQIHKVVRVNNTQLFGMYVLYREELGCDTFNQGKVKEYMLYHATSIKNAESIAYNNIDWRRTTRSRYGKGACFACTPGYADEHSSSHEGRSGLIVLAFNFFFH